MSDPWRDGWELEQVPLFVALIKTYPRLYQDMAGSGICHCGSGLDEHSWYDYQPHNPVEMMYF